MLSAARTPAACCREGWGLIARPWLCSVGSDAGCLRLWVGAAPFLGVEIPNCCCLWLLQAGCPCSSLQCLPSARAWGPLSVTSPERTYR